MVGPQGFRFTWDQIVYVLVPDEASWQRVAAALLDPLLRDAQMLAGAFGDQDPNTQSAEGDVRDCYAALDRIPVRTLTQPA